MALNIKNIEVEQLAREVANFANESKTEAILQALLERRAQLHARSGNIGQRGSLRDYFERNVWPMIPPSRLGRAISRRQEDRILGYGPDRV